MSQSEIFSAWPQLSQKALIDFVNGTESAGELVRFRSRRTSLLGRLGALVTGRDTQETQLIFQTMLDGQTTTINWLMTVQNAQAESDLALAAVVRATKALRVQVGNLQSEISDRLNEFEKSIVMANERINDVCLATYALSEIDRVLGNAKAMYLPPLPTAFYVVDSLWWGPFGNFLRRPGEDHTRLAENILLQAKRNLAELLLNQFGVKVPTLFSMNTYAEGVQSLGEAESLIIKFLSAGASDSLTPLHFILGEPTTNGNLPRTLPGYSSTDRISMRMWSETKWLSGVRINEKP